MKIIIVNGVGGSGKTTFENYCLDELGYYGEIYSTIDIVKDIYSLLGWDGTKDDESRKFLSDLKQFLEDHGNLVYKYTCNVIESLVKSNKEYGIDPDEMVFFVDCREPEMIDMFKRDYETYTLLITGAAGPEWSNSSDKNVNNYNYDYYISNDGTLEDLKNKAKEFIIII